MKTIYLVVALWLGLTSSVLAQSQFVQGQDNLMDLQAGPIVTGGAAVNAGDVSTGIKTSPCGAFSAGALFDFTYTSNWGFDLGVAYDARYINFHNAINTATGVTYSFGYIALRPELRFSGFLIGVGLGLPVSASTFASGSAVAPRVSSGDVNSLFEGRLGRTVELMRSTLGTLNFTIEGSYAFSKNINSSWFHGADDTKNNGPLAILQAGFNYLFDLLPETEMPPIAIVHAP